MYKRSIFKIGYKKEYKKPLYKKIHRNTSWHNADGIKPSKSMN